MSLPLTPHDADVTLTHARLTCFSFLSSDKKTKLAAYRFTPVPVTDPGPESEPALAQAQAQAPTPAPVAVLQVTHGMCEYLLRYTALADFLCAANIEVWGYDQLGHGYSANGEDSLGFIAPERGADFLIEDVHLLTREIRKARMDLPIFLLGHSMGSFIVRNVLTLYGKDYRGAVLVGTAGNQSPTGFGKLAAGIVGRLRGKTYRSPFIKKNSFAGYNRDFGPDAPDVAWLSRDNDLLERYMADPFCNYSFTTQGFYDLFDLLGRVSKKKWARLLPGDLPVLMLSGDADPVGARGKGPRQVLARLQKAGVRDVTLHLYPGARHEVLTELNQNEVRADLLAWLEERI